MFYRAPGAYFQDPAVSCVSPRSPFHQALAYWLTRNHEDLQLGRLEGISNHGGPVLVKSILGYARVLGMLSAVLMLQAMLQGYSKGLSERGPRPRTIRSCDSWQALGIE
jgi:hypothetical protein